ncbi:Nuclear receptor domain-containing protein [Aphelenchoides fujianensis]|nr:Nuclear receptor domain-containing protein [Aphelenchoides fujianensis]
MTDSNESTPLADDMQTDISSDRSDGSTADSSPQNALACRKRSANRSPKAGAREPKRKCAICGAPAFCQHFGAIACNSCAAFFRRTVSCQHRYTCAHNKTCEITSFDGRTLCKACRFSRCITEGMSIGAVISTKAASPFPNLDANTLLWKIVLAQRATYLSRYQSLIRSYGGNQAITKLGVENPTCMHISIAVASEVPVLVEYMRATRIDEVVDSKEDFYQLSKALFYPWLCFTVVMHNLRNRGHKTNLAYAVDESYIKVNWDTVGLMLSSCRGLKNCQVVLEYTMAYYKMNLEMASRVHAMRFEDFEHSAMFHIFALQLISKLQPANTKRLVSSFKDYATILELNGHVPVVARTLGCSVRLAELSGEFLRGRVEQQQHILQLLSS